MANGVIHVIDRLLNPSSTNQAPNPSTRIDNFANPQAATNVPFTSGIPTPTSTIGTEALPSATGPSTGSSSSEPSSNASSGGSKTHVGAIAGGVIGGVLGLALVILAVWFCRRRAARKRDGQSSGNGPARTATTKSWHKPELAAGETKESSSLAKTASPEAASALPRTRTELSAEERMRHEAPGNEVTRAQGPEREQLPQQPQQQHQPTSPRPDHPRGDLVAHQRRLAELDNERRIAELEHDHRMRLARLEHERRLAELDVSGDAARVRSQGEVSELDVNMPKTS